jgi:hypothetical protein
MWEGWRLGRIDGVSSGAVEAPTGMAIALQNKTAGHAYGTVHYSWLGDDSRDVDGITAVGECAWYEGFSCDYRRLTHCLFYRCVADGLTELSSLAVIGRLNDVAYYAGWGACLSCATNPFRDRCFAFLHADMLNYWPNFLQGEPITPSNIICR